jgi:hypothetical protein
MAVDPEVQAPRIKVGHGIGEGENSFAVRVEIAQPSGKAESLFITATVDGAPVNGAVGDLQGDGFGTDMSSAVTLTLSRQAVPDSPVQRVAPSQYMTGSAVQRPAEAGRIFRRHIGCGIQRPGFEPPRAVGYRTTRVSKWPDCDLRANFAIHTTTLLDEPGHTQLEDP